MARIAHDPGLDNSLALLAEGYSFISQRCKLGEDAARSTNHDPRIWEEPQAFRPERFANGRVNDYHFIPQGDGDLYNGHRCPGEGVAVELIEVALHMLTSAMTYDVPHQNLKVALSDLPAAPKDRFRIRDVVALG
ncbi:MAG TPA: cytochrome P450 [Modicisalibacter sp.]|nr:cytochrome P450 [Modicisalibacter sp.]